MKNLKTYIVFALAVITAACSEDDKLTVITQDTVTRGAVIRTIANDPNSFIFDDGASLWTIEIEEQDHEDGALLSGIDVFVNFVDQTPDDGTVTTTETMIANIPASAFSAGVNGLPRTTYSLSYSDALAALGIPLDPSYASDAINIRMALNLTDGRSFTDVDGTGNVTGGSFFSSPYAYRAAIVCPPKSSSDPGTWTIEMQDSFGDGWNDASLDIIIDGAAQNFTFTTGSAATFTFDLPVDAQVLSIMFRSGGFDEEVTFQVFSASGTEVLNLGTNPPVDVELLDYCTDF